MQFKFFKLYDFNWHSRIHTNIILLILLYYKYIWNTNYWFMACIWKGHIWYAEYILKCGSICKSQIIIVECFCWLIYYLRFLFHDEQLNLKQILYWYRNLCLTNQEKIGEKFVYSYLIWGLVNLNEKEQDTSVTEIAE